MEEAERLCDRVVILDEGVAIASGAVSEVIRDSGLASSIALTLARAPDAGLAERLESLGALAAEGSSYRLDGLASTGELTSLLEAVARSGNDVTELELHRPNLGDVFLHLTGKALRD